MSSRASSIGRTLGKGSFAKVKFARNTETGDNVAIKILDKEKVFKHQLFDQIKREISTMKLIRHPNVIHIYEVMASKERIYIIMELVTGGELYDKIVSKGGMKEDEARKYFQQLINAVDYCHSRSVFHRDLKPENLLLDASGTLKVSDFGFSALPQQVREDGLLHTTCGTPNYVAPEISKADFTCPSWWSASVKKLVKRILDPNPLTRVTMAEVMQHEWFKKGYEPPTFDHGDVSLDGVDTLFDDSTDSQNLVVERREEGTVVPATLNAFELISKSQGLNLGTLLEKQMGLVKRETRFISKCPAGEIVAKIEQAAAPLGFDVKKSNSKMKLLGEKIGRKGHLAVTTEIFEVVPSLCMVELRKSSGDPLEFHKFYKDLHAGLKDIVWTTDEANLEEGTSSSSTGASASKTS